MARFDLINEFTSVYVPSRPAHPTRHNRKVTRWTLRLAPIAAIAVVIVALAAH